MNIDRSLVIKIGIGIGAIVALIVLVGFIMQLVQILLPVAIVGLLAYLGYRWYARQQKAKGEGEVVTVEAESTVEQKRPKTVRVQKTETSTTEATGFEASPERAARIAELEKRLSDQQKHPAETTEATDDLQTQIEERRRRLGMDGDG